MSVRQVYDPSVLPALQASGSSNNRSRSEESSDFVSLLRGSIDPAWSRKAASPRTESAAAAARSAGAERRADVAVRISQNAETAQNFRAARDVRSASADAADEATAVSEGFANRAAESAILPRVRGEDELPPDERLLASDPKDAVLDAAALEAAALNSFLPSNTQPALPETEGGRDGEISAGPDAVGTVTASPVLPVSLKQILNAVADSDSQISSDAHAVGEGFAERSDAVETAFAAAQGENARLESELSAKKSQAPTVRTSVSQGNILPVEKSLFGGLESLVRRAAGGASSSAATEGGTLANPAQRDPLVQWGGQILGQPMSRDSLRTSAERVGRPETPIVGGLSLSGPVVDIVSARSSSFAFGALDPQWSGVSQAEVPTDSSATLPLPSTVSVQMEGPKNGEKLLVPGARMETQAPQTVFRARDSVSRDAGAPLETSGGEAGQVQVRVAAEEQNRTGVGDSRPAVPVTHASGETAQNSGTEKAVFSAAPNAFLQSSLQAASDTAARGGFDRFPASSPLSREPQTDKAELENRVGTRGAQEGLQGMQPPTTSFDLNEFGSNAGSSGEQGGALLSGGDTGAERMVATVSGAQISQPLTGSQGPVQGARPSVEVSRAELWDQIREMVQRVRSENPSHLSVEVRLQDGATVGIELRMRPTGLEASFRSESPALLRGLEAQWAGFLANEASGLQISHTAFESRSSLGNFADGGRDQREMREQMEDSAANAALSQRRNSGEGKNRNPGNSPRR